MLFWRFIFAAMIFYPSCGYGDWKLYEQQDFLKLCNQGMAEQSTTGFNLKKFYDRSHVKNASVCRCLLREFQKLFKIYDKKNLFDDRFNNDSHPIGRCFK